MPGKPGELSTPDKPRKTQSANKRRRNPPKRASGQRLLLEDYQLLVEGYRRYPGEHAKAAKLASVSSATAQRAWFYGLGAAYEFGRRPLKDVIGEEQTLARAEITARVKAESEAAADRARRAEDPTGLASRQLPASVAEAARKDAVNARAQEAALVRACRSNATALAAIMTRVIRGSMTFARNLEQRIADDKDMPIDRGVLLIKRVGEAARTAAQTADLVLEAERKLLGDSDTVPDESTMTASEAVRVIDDASDALDRARAMGFVVHEGGRSPHKPGQLPSWDDAPGGAPGASEPAIPDYEALEGELGGDPSSPPPEALPGLDVPDDDPELPADADEAW
jgi:hypothetical protein